MLVSRSLVVRAERAASEAISGLVRAMRSTTEGPLPEARPFGAGSLIAMGAGRYVNRAVGVSLDALTAQDIESIEDWYLERNLTPAVEVSSWTDAATLAQLATRQFTTSWFRSIFLRPCSPDGIDEVTSVTIEPVSDQLVERWLGVFAVGSGVTDPHATMVSDEYAIADRAIAGCSPFLASIDGVAVGCASVVIIDATAWLGTTATLPEFRGQGVQRALVRHRLAYARERGCDLAGASAVPSGTSARNLTRLGFDLAEQQVVLEQRSRP